ncbi:MAG: GntR family transcriptional regulator [Clostridia bacterium]|nr:GntR family transcriptional regulator [Clostridia bacterium]
MFLLRSGKMFEIDQKSRTPVYMQIKEQIMLFIQLGILNPNDQLPSIRELSKQLSLNVNTVKRAFSELEIEGVIFTMVGRGCFVSENAFSNTKIKEDALRDLRYVINSSIAKGISKNEILVLLNELYKEV